MSRSPASVRRGHSPEESNDLLRVCHKTPEGGKADGRGLHEAGPPG